MEIQYKFQYKLKGSVHGKFGILIKGVPKRIQRQNSRPGSAKKTAEPLQIETGVPNQFRRRIFYVLNSMYPISLVKSTASEPGLSVYKKR